MSFAAAMLVAALLDIAIGWPERLYARIGHPVTWIGAIIEWLDDRLNTGSPGPRRRAGAVAVGGVLAAVLVPSILVQVLLPDTWLGIAVAGVLAWPFVAIRSMYSHVAAVARPLTAQDLPEARKAVAMIVGRDPARLDADGVARAALESLAENTSDGIWAPLFWGALAGLPGIAAYKAINTLDSMIGHRTTRHADFGTAAARLDDLVNLVPARLTGLLFLVCSYRWRAAWRTMRRDAPRHRSPNAGWPEGAMAGALGVRLSGPRVYQDRIADEPWLNAGAPDPTPRSLRQGLRLYLRTMCLCVAILAGLAVL
ncbi:MAG: adenosylcobinamide-phosphate synthase CbiB [Pseudomonadota bacterium]